MTLTPTASYSLTIRLALPRQPGSFARAATAIGDAGGTLGAIDLVDSSLRGQTVRDVTVSCVDEAHGERIVAALGELDGIEIRSVSDRTFLLHLGGKIEVNAKVPITGRDDLSMAYTPGVARISQAIADDPAAAWNLTIKRNTVAVVTDGSAVLGLGDLGPAAAMPVMEGKAMLFKEFGGVDAFPICLDARDPDEIVAIVRALAPGFGGINLEDIAAPRCFEIEQRLRAVLDIPVFHDDQHGTAIVVLAALINAFRVVGKALGEARVVVVGVGAAGTACTDILLAHGVADVIGVDEHGIVSPERAELDPARAAYAERTNRDRRHGDIRTALAGADAVVGVSRAGAIPFDALEVMSPDPIVFALANPTPEIAPEVAEAVAAVVATGRSDYPNQINNVLAFPGVFRGALDVRAREINEAMERAAAEALARVIEPSELHEEYILPSVFNRDVAPAVAAAVGNAARESGVAGRSHDEPPSRRGVRHAP